MPLPTGRRRALLVLFMFAAVGIAAYFVWRTRAAPPRPGSDRYERYAELFEVGTAALDAGLWPQAEENLNAAIQLVPEEPAAWANRGLLQLRRNKLPEAKSDLDRAARLAPNNGDIDDMFGHLLERGGKAAEAAEHARRASEADPENVQRLFRLVGLANIRGQAGNAERARVLDALLEKRPTSLPVLIERLKVAAQTRDEKTMRDSLARLGRLSPAWDKEARDALAKLVQEIDNQDDDPTLVIAGLANLLKVEPGYGRSANELSPPGGQVGASIQQLVKLAPLKTDPSPPDADLTFPAAQLAWTPEAIAKEDWDKVVPVWLNGRDTAAVLVANATEVRRGDAAGPAFAFPGAGKPPSLDGVLAVDWNNDHATDFVLAGAGGVRFHQQNKGGTFADITDRTKLPPEVLKADCWGAWAADVDQDGDLDLVLATRDAGVWLLQNNGDGTFLAKPIFPDVERARAFRWADLDNDGAADAVLLDASGRMHIYRNERSGQFRRREVPAVKYVALAVIDGDDDGVFDLAAVRDDGRLVLISDRDKGKSWNLTELAKADAPTFAPGEARLVAVDLDASGTVDLVLRAPKGGVAWLADGKGGFAPLAAALPPGVADVVSLECNEHLDLLGFNEKNQLKRWRTQGTKGYHWYRVRPRANPLGTGDQRLNSFAIGSEIEVRSGTLITKQPVERPVVPFGLGTRSRVAVTRCVWTTGAQQFEFDKAGDTVVTIDQRLTGSCPFLFTHDGEKMVFVTDFCWSTPLGLYINAQKRGGGFVETTEWVRIRADQLRPRDGLYDVRVNANLWETHFLDQLSLMAVDHPPGTEVFCDERFFLTPTKPRVYVTETPKPVARALDHQGHDVTEIVRQVDGRYLDRAGRGLYQGVTKDHWVEVDLGDDAPKTGPLYLIARGWLHPTDSSINAALEQSSHPRPQPLSLEVPDGKGGWRVALPALGFPAGKFKTVVLRLDGLDGPGVSRRFRLRTNLEIFWDALHYARPADDITPKPLACRGAELRPRGILKMSRADASSPEVPRYDQVEYGRQHWRDLIGFHTRFGDVRELVEKVDDRYVILNAGDEIAMTFTVPPPPPAGWTRDFVWVSDGWTKDGNMNTRWSKTVLPLPYHGMGDYEAPPGRLEDDPAYKKHPNDWRAYHTRYITPADFERGLRGDSYRSYKIYRTYRNSNP